MIAAFWIVLGLIVFALTWTPTLLSILGDCHAERTDLAREARPCTRGAVVRK